MSGVSECEDSTFQTPFHRVCVCLGILARQIESHVTLLTLEALICETHADVLLQGACICKCMQASISIRIWVCEFDF